MGGVQIWRGIKRRGRAAMLPCVLFGLAGFFGWSSTQGDRGLEAKALRQADLAAAQSTLARAQSDLKAWERRVAALRTDRLNSDVLDERARAMLNLSDPADLILPYGEGKKLF